MSSRVVCSHLDQVSIFDRPAEVAGCEECLKIGGRWVHWCFLDEVMFELRPA